MADTFTPNLNLNKPEIGASRDAWGAKWNGNADLIDTAVKQLKDQLANLQTIPVGMIADFSFATPPTGWLKCNGASLLRTDYANLFAAIGITFGAVDSTHFNLPDIRGYFRRALDDGRGIDANRTLGSLQASQNLSHNHAPSNNFRMFTEGPDYPVQLTGGSGTESLTYYTTSNGGAEARPVNIAFPAFIKY